MNRHNWLRALGVDLRLTLSAPNFWIAALMLYAVLMAEVADAGVNRVLYGRGEFGDAYNFNISLHFGYYIYAAPLLCAFAASGQFVGDVEAGFYRLRLLRSGRTGYQYALFVGATLGGGLALMLGVLLFAASCAALFGPYAPAADLGGTPDAWLPLLERRDGNWLFMLTIAAQAFAFGAIWSGAGLVATVFSPNRYVGYLVPFIICFCCALALPPWLQPLEMLLQLRWQEGFEFYKLAAYQAALYLATMACFRLALERRLRRENG